MKTAPGEEPIWHYPKGRDASPKLPADKPHLLIIDGDVISFIAAAAVQKYVQDEYGNVSAWADIREGIAVCDGLIQKYRGAFNSNTPKDDAYLVVLSDHEDNWRYDVARSYKGNRVDTIPPMLLAPLKAHLIANHNAQTASRLEADDFVGMLMTDPAVFPEGYKVAVGRDKDFFSIPGWHYQIPQKEHQEDLDTGPFLISLEEADRWHAIQSLGGDMTDGFPGCTGIGYKRAAQIVDECMALLPGERKVTRGLNKGKTVTSWNRAPAETLWDCIVSNYLKAGLSENEALETARLSRILRYGEYDKGEVKMWNPSFPRMFRPEDQARA